MSAAERPPADAKAMAKPRGLLVPMLISAVVAAGTAAGAVYFITKKAPAASAEGEAPAAEHGAEKVESGGEHGEGKGGKKGSALYFSLAPSFVVNLNDSDASRFLQTDIEVLTHDPATIEALKLHTPQIRSSLLLLLGQQKYLEMETREGKEALQKSVLEEIQRIMTDETGKPGAEAVFFTTFVMQ